MHGVGIKEAMELTAATILPRAMYTRIEKWKTRLKKLYEEESIAELALTELRGKADGGSLESRESPTLFPLADDSADSASCSNKKKRTSSHVATLEGIVAKSANKTIHTKAQQEGIDNLPGWMDGVATSQTMFTRKKRSRKEKSKDDFSNKVTKECRDRKFATVWKMATTQLYENNSGPNKGGRGYGSRAVMQQFNTLLNSPGDKKITHRSLSRTVKEGHFGKSPQKNGRPTTIPEALKKATAVHTVMMQVNGEAEASKSTLLTTTNTLVVGTKWEGSFRHKYLQRAARSKYPEIMNPVRAKNHEDRRVDWLSYKNIVDWTERAKDYLIGIDMLSPEPGFIHGVPSLCSLIHPDDVDHFIVMDETHHRFSTAGNRGGSSEFRYSCSSFSRPGNCVIENERHTTGVYGFTLRGEPLPPLYILDSKGKDEDNFKIDPLVCEGLPMPMAKLGQKSRRRWPSQIAVRNKGGMNTSLWHELNRKVYLPGWKGKISKTTVRDPVTKRLITGPLINKTDGGPGRLATEAKSFEFREEMLDIGMHILLSIPNGTECNAEPDQLYGDYKPRCKNSTIRVAAAKMHARVNARNKSRLSHNDRNTANLCAVDALPDFTRNADYCQRFHDNIQANHFVGNVEDGVAGTAHAEDGVEANLDDEDHEDPVKADDFAFSVGRSVCAVNLGNRDLGHITNGFSGDDIEDRPFGYCFQMAKLVNQWIKVGFLPMTLNAVNDPKVRFELGKGGAPAKVTERLNMLVEDYEALGSKLSTLGFNGHVLDLKPRMVEGVELPKDEEAQIQHIIKNKIISKAGGLFKIGIHVANCRVVLEASRRMKAMEMEKEKQKAIDLEDAEARADGAAMKHFMKWKEDGKPEERDSPGRPKLQKAGAVAIVKVLVRRISPEENVSKYTGMKLSIDRLMAIAGGTTWVDEMQQVLVEKGNGGRLFSLPSIQNETN